MAERPESAVLPHDLASHGAEAVDELFHDPSGKAYGSIVVDGDLQTWPLPSGAARDYLTLLQYRTTEIIPSGQDVNKALDLLAAQARLDGPTRPVAVRLAAHTGQIYLDLGREVVVIAPGNWHITGAHAVPVRFWRPSGFLSLPTPARSGSLEPLRRFLNLERPDDVILITSCLVGWLYPVGAQPLLQLVGEQGSAKSTLARLLRSLIDPNQVPLRPLPGSERDLLVSAQHVRILAFDNLTTISPTQSDWLCRQATGGGFATRQLYSDSGEVLLEARRPVIVTAVSDVVTASDLLDRTVTVQLRPIPPDQRRTDAEIEAMAAEVRPTILAGLLDAAAMALARVSTVHLDRLPRLADFCQWGEAASPALGWAPGTLLTAMETNRRDADALTMETVAIAPVVIRLTERGGTWRGTATELLGCLHRYATPEERKAAGWPRTASHCSQQLQRLAPSLRRHGITVATGRTADKRTIALTRTRSADGRHRRHRRHDPSPSPFAEPAATGTPARAPWWRTANSE